MATYFISDLHFFHGNILNMDGRDFANITEMADSIVKKWNSKVKEEDHVYILGDLSWERGAMTYDLLLRLHGKLHLIEGNHDYWFLDDPNFDDFIFEEVVNYAQIKVDGKNLNLSHYPMPFYNHQFQRKNDEHVTYMLYGHVHNTYDEYMLNRFINDASGLKRVSAGGETESTPFQMINVFCVFSDYEPLTIEEWIEIDKKRRNLVNEFETQNNGLITQDKWNELNKKILYMSKNHWV